LELNDVVDMFSVLCGVGRVLGGGQAPDGALVDVGVFGVRAGRGCGLARVKE